VNRTLPVLSAFFEKESVESALLLIVTMEKGRPSFFSLVILMWTEGPCAVAGKIKTVKEATSVNIPGKKQCLAFMNGCR
jgi:hypothetical protein